MARAKSTLAERLHRYLVQQGISSSFYDEGTEGHPASLNGHAFFREEEYKELPERYPNTANEIRSRAIKDGSNYLLPYREFSELCWTDSPIAALSEFTYSIQRQWARFAKLVSTSEKVYVLEAVFFQH